MDKQARSIKEAPGIKTQARLHGAIVHGEPEQLGGHG